MTAYFCPECYVPVDIPRHAREGRCPDCRPQRRHSEPRSSNWTAFIADHNKRTP